MQTPRFLKTGVTIHSQRRRIVHPGLDLQGTNTLICAEGSKLRQRGLAQSTASKCRLNKQVVNKCNGTSILHAVAERHYHVPDILGIGLDEPNVAQALVGQQRLEGVSGAASIENVWRLRVELGHHGHQLLKIVYRSSS